MDEIELLVAETFRHYEENQSEIEKKDEFSFSETEESAFPENPGILYHVQKTSSVFVVRTLVSQNIKKDFYQIIERPEDYPSLRLLEGGETEVSKKLKFFIVENPAEAEIIHDQVHNRRFPVNEELMCNLSDPGFSWWLAKKPTGFQISFTISMASNDTVKLGPLGDRELAIRNFQALGSLVSSAGLEMNIQNEMNRVQFTDCEEFILEELKDVFEFGVITDTMKDIFKILSRKVSDAGILQETWFYLNELAAMRRFWIQVQYDLTNN